MGPTMPPEVPDFKLHPPSKPSWPSPVVGAFFLPPLELHPRCSLWRQTEGGCVELLTSLLQHPSDQV